MGSGSRMVLLFAVLVIGIAGAAVALFMRSAAEQAVLESGVRDDAGPDDATPANLESAADERRRRQPEQTKSDRAASTAESVEANERAARRDAKSAPANRSGDQNAAPPATLADLEQRLADMRVLDAADRNPRDMILLLRALRDHEDPAGLDMVLAFLDDPALTPREQSHLAENALVGSNDPRIPEWARERMEQRIGSSDTALAEVNGLLRILAVRGGEDGARYIHSLLTERGVSAAAFHVADIRQPELARMFLDLVANPKLDDRTREEVAVGMARWNSEEVRAELWEFASSDEAPRNLRQRLISPFSSIVEPHELGDMAREYWTLDAGPDRDRFLRSMVPIRGNRRIEDVHFETHVAPMVLDRLLASDPAVALTAAQFARDIRGLHTEEIVESVEQLLERVRGTELEAGVVAVLETLGR